MSGAIAALFTGTIADKLGRRNTIIISDVFLLVGSLVLAISLGSVMLCLGRLIVGVGLGISMMICPIFL